MPMNEGDLLALIDTYASQSYGGSQGQLATERALAIARYNCEPLGNEIDGRSALVSSELRDTVETVIPQLQRIFLGGDQICEFDPETPEDVPQAKQESKYVNWVVTERNSAYQVFGTWFRDALLCKNGYVKAWWEERSDIKLETYQGLTDDQLQMLSQDQTIQIVAHTANPMPGMPPAQPLPGAMMQAGQMQPPPASMSHDVQIRRLKQYGCVKLDNIPSEEIKIHQSVRGLDLQDALFVEHSVVMTLSEIRQMGIEVADDEAGTLDDLGELEANARDRFQDIASLLQNQESSDPAARKATFREIYMRVDEDGDGIAELRKICMVNRKIKSDEETDVIPIASITPVIQPHRHIGYGYYDFLKDIEQARTALIRGYYDNLYLANNGRYGVNVKNVNVDDLLISRPGGVVRVDGPPQENIFPLTHPSMGDAALAGMQYLDAWKKNATGVMADSQTLSADVLNNSTATGISQAISVWQARVEGVARCFAETGMKDLFRIVHALTLKHATAPEKFSINGEWQQVDPREWAKRTSLTVTVGLGSGSKEAKMAFLQNLIGMLTQGLQIGVATPTNIYEAGMEMVKEMGYKDGDRFLTDPRKTPPQPPQKDPMVQAEEIKAQAQMQMAQVKAQTDQQIQAARMQADMQVQQHDAQVKSQLELEKHRMQMQVDDMKHSREQQTQLQIAVIKAKAQVDAAQITATKSAEAGNIPDPEAAL